MRNNKCECAGWAVYGSESFGNHHHCNCKKYNTEKYPYLLYYENALDCWLFTPDSVDQIISAEDQFEDGSIVEIEFKRKDFTDAEIDCFNEVEGE